MQPQGNGIQYLAAREICVGLYTTVQKMNNFPHLFLLAGALCNSHTDYSQSHKAPNSHDVGFQVRTHLVRRFGRMPSGTDTLNDELIRKGMNRDRDKWTFKGLWVPITRNLNRKALGLYIIL